MRTKIDGVGYISGYELIETLYQGSKTLVYRANRLADQQAVVIKLLQQEYPTFSELLQFRNQYTITKNLNSLGIVRPYSLELYHNSYILVMEDFGGISLREYTENKHLELLAFLHIALQLADILHELYLQRVIHKDIKPANILIHPETKQVKLIDFSIASLLPRETQTILSPKVLEGTLAYLSPEQTGRMNRGIDYRSDFYSLGVTFFELLTGKLPFVGDDAMELVHCHIAQEPSNLFDIKPDIPKVISAVVSKLMAKNAEDRYQSALGLKYDLEKCLCQLQQTNQIEDFKIGERDICDRFIIPEKLYGRETEVEQLLEAFERISQGKSELMLVTGFSGIGKTAVVNEVHKPIVRQRGYFIKGKFDQFNRNIPFSAFVQAFRNLMAQLLSESDVELQQWKTKILKALGENAQVIIEVIPELQRIIGDVAPAPELSGSAAQNRFNLLFEKFFQVFTTVEHPLVMFLDDLQWIDSASLKLMQLLMNESQRGYLLLIGAYRDNEVFPAHPLMLMLNELRKVGATVNTITLAPLTQRSLNQLVAETLNCATDLALPLTELVYQKTQGNPFFATQFLKALYQDGLVIFDLQAGHWQCNISKVREAALTDDVVAFMAQQLQKLPPQTQEVLKLAACIGNQFDLATLGIVCEQSETESAAHLWKALQEGLVLPTTDVYKFFQDVDSTDRDSRQQVTATYRFLHDRVQQAAYFLIAEELRPSTHLKIGQLLLSNTSSLENEDNIFEIINQLNFGKSLVIDQIERNKLAELNLIAGRKAKTATAYEAALVYLSTGLELLASESWENQYQLTLSLYEEATEAACLCGDFVKTEQLAQEVLQHGKTLIDILKVYEVKIQASAAQGRNLDGIAIGLQVLELLGGYFPKKPIQSDTQKALSEIAVKLQAYSMEDLLNLPAMIDIEKLAFARILSKLIPSFYIVAPEFHPLSVVQQINLLIEYGNSVFSPFAYVSYGLLLNGITRDIAGAYRFGRLGIDLIEFYNAHAEKSRTYALFGMYIAYVKEHIQVSIKFLKEGYQSGLENGDILFAGYNIYMYCQYSLLSGKELNELSREIADYHQRIAQMKQKHVFILLQIYHQVVLNLLGNAENSCRLSGEYCDEEQILSLSLEANDIVALSDFYINKMMLSYLFNDLQQAWENTIKAEDYLGGCRGNVNGIVFYFYDSLVRLKSYSSVSDSEREEILLKVSQNQKQIQPFAHHAPMNFQHKYDLVEAEKSRVLKLPFDALETYDKAIKGAKENGYLQEESLANELAAQFYLEWGKEKVAQAYMQEAYYCYARWGALAKVNDLEKRYPHLLQPILQQRRLNLNPLETIATAVFAPTSSSTQGSSTGSTSISDVLDFTSLLKASQAISSSIELNELIANLTRIILENSGAKKSALILPQEDIWQVKAITYVNYSLDSQIKIQTLLNSQLIDTCEDIPRKLIQYVKNTQQTVIIDNLQTDIPGVIGEYMLQHQPKSVLCIPILNQGHLVGILYLENKVTQGVFTNQRLEVIKLLSSQAAISLENAMLYQQAQMALHNLQQAQLQIVQSEKMSALGNLVAGVAHEMNNPLGFISASLKQTQPTLADVIEHLRLYQQTLPNPTDEIINHAEEIDLHYILEDLPKVINSMTIACERIKNISTSLRTFSRADKDYKQSFNIHSGLDSTILILKHRLKANEQRPAIEVVTEYGNLPEIECFPGQLNQVFMNILANAIDALEEANIGRSFEEIKANPNGITIKTSVENNQVKITIADNGIGMSEEVKQRIFDHLFTTKIIGKGTGLGLAIAHQIIVEKHSGVINVKSVPGEGTEFEIQIPIKENK
jgi:predicted ATPase/signal transduction histidine kinase/tRNA A-37 threonylcarbamoyl transferase component Bud32